MSFGRSAVKVRIPLSLIDTSSWIHLLDTTAVRVLDFAPVANVGACGVRVGAACKAVIAFPRERRR